MANQQLVDYIKGQMMANVSEPDIKKILKDAGWPDAEVEEGFKGAKGVATQPAASPVVSASSFTSAAQPSVKPAEPVKTEPKKESMSFDFMTNPGGTSPAAVKDAKPKEVAKPVSMGVEPVSSGAKSSSLPWIVAGVAIIAMIGVGVYFFLQNGSLSGQVDALTATNNSLNSQLAGAKTGTASADELASAQADAKEANNELSLFIIPTSATGTPAATAFDLKGMLGSGKTGYTLTTQKGIVLNIKNSKDAKVDAALKPLVGTSVELGGSHVPGTYDIIADTLGGSVFPALATSTPPVATSTAPKANAPAATKSGDSTSTSTAK